MDGVFSPHSSNLLSRRSYLHQRSAEGPRGRQHETGIESTSQTRDSQQTCFYCKRNNNDNRIQRRYSRVFFFFFFLQSPHSAANCFQHVRSSGPGATVCKSRATHRALITCKCHVTCHLARRDSSAIKFDRVEIAFI